MDNSEEESVVNDGNGYERITKIGEGAYAEVFKAKCKKTGRIVAIKKVSMVNETEGFPITALREIQILKSLRHEHVITLHGVTRSKPTPHNRMKRTVYLVLEFCAHDLAGLLSNATIKFTLGEIKEVITQLLKGLSYIHKNNILHRDMKTANILITRDGVLKIADFGLSRKFCRARDGKENRYTDPVVALWYRPPELLLGDRDYGPAIDMWGVGCIMAEMWTRSPIMQGQTEQDQLTLITTLCGSITAEVWPDVKKFDLYHKFALPKDSTRKVTDRLKYYVRDRHALDLIDKLLTLDPKNRIDSDDALKHNIFYKDPLPSDLKENISRLQTSMFYYHIPARKPTDNASQQSHPSDQHQQHTTSDQSEPSTQ